jgi:aspartate/methionine/tyrosine aminotransferase
MGKLIEFNTSCASVFTQRAALEAITRTDEVTPRVVAHLKACRDVLVPLLQALPGVQLAMPRAACTRSSSSRVSTTRWPGQAAGGRGGAGLAPGNAFAPEAQGWLRWCFASKDPGRLGKGVDRLATWLERQARGGRG